MATPTIESEEHRALRKAVAALGARYGREYFAKVVAEGKHTDELWSEAARLGYLGVNLPRSTAAEAAASSNSPSSWRSWARPAAHF